MDIEKKNVLLVRNMCRSIKNIREIAGQLAEDYSRKHWLRASPTQ